MAAHLRPALMSLIIFTVVTGIAYPLLVAGIAQAVFPYQANGSPTVKEGKVVGCAPTGPAVTIRFRLRGYGKTAWRMPVTGSG